MCVVLYKQLNLKANAGQMTACTTIFWTSNCSLLHVTTLLNFLKKLPCDKNSNDVKWWKNGCFFP